MQNKYFSLLFIFLLSAQPAQAWSWLSWLFGASYERNKRIEETIKIVEKNDLEEIKAFIEDHKNDAADLVKVTLDTVYLEGVKTGSKEIVETALINGANLNTKDKNGKSALHWVVEGENSEMADYLMQKGIHYQKDSSGRTPAGLIQESNSENKEEWLLKFQNYVAVLPDKIAKENEEIQATTQEKQEILERLKVEVAKLTKQEIEFRKIQKEYQEFQKGLTDFEQKKEALEKDKQNYAIEEKRLDACKKEQEKLREEIEKIEQEIGTKRKRNEKNKEDAEQELKNLQALIERKKRAQAELDKLEREEKMHAREARRYAQEILKKVPQ